jgi:predicted P-loop ATPase
MSAQRTTVSETFNVFPVNLIYTQGKDKPEKKPAVRGWQRHMATLGEVSACQNLGVGVPAGHVFIDLDTYKGVTREAVEAELGVALDWDAAMIQRTVSGGEHYCFRLPDGAAVRQGSSILGIHGLDTRCHGKGWICTGEGYEDLTLTGMPAAVFLETWPELPTVAADKMKDTGTALAVEDDKAPLGYSLDQLREILSVLDPAPAAREDWLAVGMALHHETQGDREGFRLFNEWSGSRDETGALRYSKYKVEDVRVAWQSFGRKTGKGPVTTARTLRMMASEQGLFIDPNPVTAQDFDEFPCETLATGAVSDAPKFKRDKKGKIEASIENVSTAVRSSAFCGIEIRFDEFRDEIMFAEAGTGDWRPFTDADYSRLRITLERKAFKPVGRELIRDSVLLVADETHFDSAIEWLERLEWDGVKRIDSFLARYFGAEASGYVTSVSRYLWTALAGRVLAPGCKADMVPILVGPQGAGKSSGVAAMVPDAQFFAEISFHEKEEDLARKMRGRLVGEIGELRGLHTRELEHIKAFITRTHENWIPKYREFAVTFPRRLVFIGTTNQQEFLADETGNRRWLPVQVLGSDVDAIAADRLQLWAEARESFKASGIAFRDAERLGKDVHEDHMIKDSWQEVVTQWLDEPDLLTGDPNRNKAAITGMEILTDALNFDKRHIGRKEEQRIAKVMKSLGYQRQKARISGKSVWAYVPDVPF